MTDLNDYEVLLMVDPDKNTLYPFSAFGFTVTQDPVARTLARSTGLLFLGADGIVRRIAGMHADNPGFFSRLGAVVGLGAIGIKVDLAEVPVTLDAFKVLVVNGLRTYREQLGGEDENWTLIQRSAADAEATIAATSSFAELYKTLELPMAEDCLDLL